MSKRKVAPTLRSFVGNPWTSGWKPYPNSTSARAASQRELRALLRVARAARNIKPYSVGWQDRCEALFKAIASLDKVSGGGR